MVERVWDSETGEVLRAGMSVAEIEGTEPGEKLEVKVLVITDKWTEENEGYLAITPEKQEQLARMWWAVAAINYYDARNEVKHTSLMSDSEKYNFVEKLASKLVSEYLENQENDNELKTRTRGRVSDPTKLIIFLEHDEKIKVRDAIINPPVNGSVVFDELSGNSLGITFRVDSLVSFYLFNWGGKVYKLYPSQGWLYKLLIYAVNRNALAGVGAGVSLLEGGTQQLYYAILEYSKADFDRTPFAESDINRDSTRAYKGDWVGGDFVKNK
jgi:hypothetical protein